MGAESLRVKGWNKNVHVNPALQNDKGAFGVLEAKGYRPRSRPLLENNDTLSYHSYGRSLISLARTTTFILHLIREDHCTTRHHRVFLR